MLDFDQITSLVVTIVVLVVQYTGAVGKTWGRITGKTQTTSGTTEANANSVPDVTRN